MGIISVGASIVYKASDVTYLPENTEWNVNNVQEAIDEINSRENM